MKKHRRADTVMLAIALFTVSGIGLAYNLSTAAGEEIAVSLSALANEESGKSSAISEYAAANLIQNEAVAASASLSEPPSDELLAPIVTPPSQ